MLDLCSSQYTHLHTHIHSHIWLLRLGLWRLGPPVRDVTRGGGSVSVEPSWGHGYRSRDSQAITVGACGRLCSQRSLSGVASLSDPWWALCTCRPSFSSAFGQRGVAIANGRLIDGRAHVSSIGGQSVSFRSDLCWWNLGMHRILAVYA